MVKINNKIAVGGKIKGTSPSGLWKYAQLIGLRLNSDRKEVDMIGLNRRRMMGGEKLPYDAEIEYLESTGTQWIDTGIDTNPFDVGFATKIYYPNPNSERAILGNNTRAVFEFYVINNNIGLFNDSSQHIIFNNMAVDTIHIIEGTMSTEELSLTVDGEKKKEIVATNSSTTRRLILFRHNNRYYYIGRLYYMRINIGGKLVRDFIPVRIDTTGYMYDKVSKQLFGNSGTGEFILGPDINSDNS